MKSGPTWAEATAEPRARSAAIRPVATVVFPTPEWVPAMTSRGPNTLTRSRSLALWRELARSREEFSILDALLGPDALVVGVLDLSHLGGGVGHLDELVGRVP